MRKSGNAAIRLFLTLITDPISEIFVFESISILASDHPLVAHPIVRSGHIEAGRGHRLLMAEYIPVSPFGFGFLR